EDPGVCYAATGACDFAPRGGGVPLPIAIVDLGTLGGATSAVAPFVGAFEPGVSVVGGDADTADGERHAFAIVDGALVDASPDAVDARAIAATGDAVFFAYEDDQGAAAVAIWREG